MNHQNVNQEPTLDNNVVEFLQSAMNHELELCKTIHELLLSEQQLLEKQKSDELAKILTEKSNLINELEASTARRFSVFGIKVIHKNPQRLFESRIQSTPALMTTWQQLKEKMFSCQTQNQVNGRIIELSRQSVARTMNLFKQALRPNNLTTYSAKGMAQQTQLNISSAKA